MKNEIIIECGVDGGSWTLVGIEGANGWRFRAIKDETDLFDLINEEPPEGIEFYRESDWVDSWEAALALFDKYPWHLFYPLRVHPIMRARFGRQCKTASTRTNATRATIGCATPKNVGTGCATMAVCRIDLDAGDDNATQATCTKHETRCAKKVVQPDFFLRRIFGAAYFKHAGARGGRQIPEFELWKCL